MNKRKSILILSIVFVILWSIIATFKYNVAQTTNNNKFTITSNSSSLKLGDNFSITLIGEFNDPEDSVQGRIEYSDDVEIIEGGYYNFEEFTNSNNATSMSQVVVGENNSIGFAISRKPNSDGTVNKVSGSQKILTFKFRVKSSIDKNVEIKWKGRNKDGLYEIASISIPRSDISGSEEETNKPIVEEPQKTVTENGETNKPVTNGKEGNNKVSIPQTGENYIYIILAVIVIIGAIIVHKIYKKNKF